MNDDFERFLLWRYRWKGRESSLFQQQLARLILDTTPERIYVTVPVGAGTTMLLRDVVEWMAFERPKQSTAIVLDTERWAHAFRRMVGTAPAPLEKFLPLICMGVRESPRGIRPDLIVVENVLRGPMTKQIKELLAREWSLRAGPHTRTVHIEPEVVHWDSELPLGTDPPYPIDRYVDLRG